MKKNPLKFNYVKNSIRTRFTFTVIITIVCTILICILINLNFLERYYVKKKQSTVISQIELINTTFDKYNFNGTDVDDDMNEKIEYILKDCLTHYNISAVIIGTDGKVLFQSSIEMMGLVRRLNQYVYEEKKVENMYKNKDYQILMYTDGRNSSRYMDAFGFLDSGCVFLLSTPIESIRESANISNKFFMITGILSAFIAGTYIYFVMRRMTKPILELSDIASKMADQDFTVKYEGCSNDEIGVLGNTMNHLSSELEKTISELKEANRKLQKDIEEKIQIDDMRKEFLSNVSHELKTPIALIQGYAEGLNECVNDDEESRNFYCEVIMDEAGKMNVMVQKLLNLNRLEFGNNTCELRKFNFVEFMNSMKEAANILMQSKNGTLEYFYNSEYKFVLGDEFMIEEVMKNYISNACNHLSENGIIKMRVDDSDENRFRISVFNTGLHIPEEQLSKVWEKFYKVDKARTREYGGSGIGLSIVKAIMEQHECPYGVYNTDGGVTFWFELNKA